MSMSNDDFKKLRKLMALFDAAAEGERLAALAAANTLLARTKTYWRDLFVVDLPKPQTNPTATRRPQPSSSSFCECEECAREVARRLIDHPDFFSLADRHRDFIQSIDTKWKRRELTEKQRDYLFGLGERLGVPRRSRTEAASA